MIAHALFKLGIQVGDRLRYSRWTQAGLGLGLAAKAQFTFCQNQRLNLLANSYRILTGAGQPGWVEPLVRNYVETPEKASVWRDQKIGWSRWGQDSAQPVISKGMVLKAPGKNGERGVILLSFEYNWLASLNARNRSELFRNYTFICSSAWSPTSYQAFWSMAHLPGANVVFFVSNRADISRFQRLQTGTKTLPFYMSHWINPDDYCPQPRKQRSIDILMIANWASFKRHWVLFKGLSRIKRPLRIVLVGQPEAGRTLEHVKREAKAFGVLDKLEFKERLPIEKVTELQCDSRISLILSRREGSCVVVAESLFADTPVGLVNGAHIGSADFINLETGMMLDETRFPEGLMGFLDQSERQQPRQWAVANISCFVSSQRLNTFLREQATKNGDPWTQDICTLGWRPNPKHVTEEESQRMAPVYQELKDQHGLVFKNHTVLEEGNQNA